MVGVGVNVIALPLHLLPAGLFVILTAGVTFGLTVTVREFETTGLLVTQFALLVNVQFTTSLFKSEVVV